MEFLSTKILASKTVEWAELLGMDTESSVVLKSPALVVVDMQNDFLEEDGLLKVWGGRAIIPNIARLIDAFHATSRPVVFSRHIYQSPETDGGATARWWKADNNSQLLRDGTWHAELHERIQPAVADRILPKRRYSAFYGTDLELLLRTSGVREVVIVGVSTNICCEATAHDAFYRDFDVVLPIDANGGTDEAAHVSTLRNLAIAYGTPVVTEQVLVSLERGHGRELL
ncbi:MAG: cysteine hydrolase, partial [Armatimonadetes bacterium]|nr:cysteine hydrolase [Armatimonadota bacterium]